MADANNVAGVGGNEGDGLVGGCKGGHCWWVWMGIGARIVRLSD